MDWDTFITYLRDWLAERSLLADEPRCVVGVSGGPDSVLLLHGLSEVARASGGGWTLTAAHLHHGLRGPDADADARFVDALAQQLEIPVHHERIDIPRHVAAHGGSTEEVARQHRYEFLQRVALKAGSENVAVGHHADDNAETILHRICRGTGLRGLGGMRDIRPIQPGSRVRLLRPLLKLRRAQVEALCATRGLTYRIDQSNLSGEFTRGWIRNELLPLIRQRLNPNVGEALVRLAEQALWLGTYLEDSAARTFESLVVSEQPRRIVLNIAALLSKPRIIQAELVRRSVSLVLAGEQDLGFPHVETVLRLAAERASGKELHLPGPVLVRKQYDRLEFRPLEDSGEGHPEVGVVFLVLPGQTSLPTLGWDLHAEICAVDSAKIDELRRGPHPYEEWIDFERIRPPLLVRGRRDGDRFHPLGAPGEKSVGDFLGDLKVDPQLRARIGVLCDQDGPIWIMPLRIDERVKLRPSSRRAVRLTLRPQPGGFRSA